MAVKILVVDDSATMRKILEMTFAAEDAEVISVENGNAAVQAAQHASPDLVLADASMGGMDGYALSAALKGNPAFARTAVMVLASQKKPFDPAKGKAAGVDDHIVKPFDTQVLINKVAEVLARPRAVATGAPAGAGAAAPAAPAAPPAAPRPPVAAAPVAAAPVAPRPPVAAAPAPPAARPVAPAAEPRPPIAAAPPTAAAPVAAAPVAATPSASRVSKTTASFGGPGAAAAPPRKAEASMELDEPMARPAPSAPATSARAATAQDGPMATKLSALGLSADQVAGILALSREVIEQVVWEVVPELAETLIREEIKRLTAD